MNTELKNYKQRLTEWIESRKNIVAEQKEEVTIKKEDLRKYCESRIVEWEPVEGHPDFAHKPEGIINEMKFIINTFCKEK